jgi:hypothetical protein
MMLCSGHAIYRIRFGSMNPNKPMARTFRGKAATQRRIPTLT